MQTRIAIIGYGNIGKAVEQAVLAAEDTIGVEVAEIFWEGDEPVGESSVHISD